jgi:hypothetical protein
MAVGENEELLMDNTTLGAFFASPPQKTGLYGGSVPALCAATASRPSNPLRVAPWPLGSHTCIQAWSFAVGMERSGMT